MPTPAEKNGAYRVADYLVDRLGELGADRIFGVPGDYSLALLDHITHHATVRWTGCANELNAGYAADGYGRLRGVGALCTTFGVGELSALNAIAGSYAEHVPVVHVVGAPSLAAQALHRPIHHSLGDGEFGHFMAMHEAVTCARAALTADNAVAEIDRVLTTVRDRRLPGYLLVPADVAQLPVSPAAAPLPPHTDTTDPEALDAFVDAARRLLERAGSVADVSVLAGLLVHRFGAAPELRRLLAAGPVPHATTPWAKIRPRHGRSRPPSRRLRPPPTTPRSARTRSGRRRRHSCVQATSCWPTKAPASTAWPRTACPRTSRSSASRCGPRSATRCPRSWAPASRRPAVAACS